MNKLKTLEEIEFRIPIEYARLFEKVIKSQIRQEVSKYLSISDENARSLTYEERYKKVYLTQDVKKWIKYFFNL